MLVSCYYPQAPRKGVTCLRSHSGSRCSSGAHSGSGWSSGHTVGPGGVQGHIVGPWHMAGSGVVLGHSVGPGGVWQMTWLREQATVSTHPPVPFFSAADPTPASLSLGSRPSV